MISLFLNGMLLNYIAKLNLRLMGLITMGKNYSKSSIVLWPPSSHIVDIMDALEDVSAVADHARTLDVCQHFPFLYWTDWIHN